MDRREAFRREALAALELPEGMINYLASGDGFRVLVRQAQSRALALQWRGILLDLVDLGFMRVSRKGRFWWV